MGGEIQLTDGIARLMAHEAVYAFQYEGKRYDCGSKEGFLEATVELALQHPTSGREVPQVPQRSEPLKLSTRRAHMTGVARRSYSIGVSRGWASRRPTHGSGLYAPPCAAPTLSGGAERG